MPRRERWHDSGIVAPSLVWRAWADGSAVALVKDCFPLVARGGCHVTRDHLKRLNLVAPMFTILPSAHLAGAMEVPET